MITLTSEQAAEIVQVLAKARSYIDARSAYPSARDIDRAIALFTPEQPSAQASVGRLFPIQDGPAVPWSVMAPHEAQCQKSHGQSLERIAERGGFSSSEAYAVVHGIAYRDIGPEFKARWRDFVASLTQPAPPDAGEGWELVQDHLARDLTHHAHDDGSMSVGLTCAPGHRVRVYRAAKGAR